MKHAVVLCLCAAAVIAAAEGIAVNGDFETGTGFGWTQWSAPWGMSRPSYDYTSAEEPYEGGYALHMSAVNGSFGVYQEFCVEPGVTFEVAWAWRGRTAGNGWWELLIIDAPYDYDMADAPSSYPEVTVAAKWEIGFGGPYPPPSLEWVDEQASITPDSDVVTVVLKCGSSEGGAVHAWFDAVTVTHASTLLEITDVAPAKLPAAGGVQMRITGRVFPAGAVATVGGAPPVEQIRHSTCLITGTAPAGAPGPADVSVTAGGKTVTLAGGVIFVPPPEITSVAPAQGPPDGGTAVTIHGLNFESLADGDISVSVGGAPLADLELLHAGAISGTTPPGTAGPADVTVATPFGTTTAAGAFTYTSAAPRFRRGDCNNDTRVDVGDPVTLLGYLFADKPEPACLEACNGNDDDRLDIADAVAILAYLFSGTGSLPAPSAVCGEDPTPSLSCNETQKDC
ncbi:MAG TPA: IPT/TIG domain-containing protein [Planctomycetota bacterium]|nr:IPT/TIG domain-containing protein [Planctomycetota bacterium]HNS00428.1 IPT/TIG domain-containing protein [Planctomycetota bacterium]HNU27509.1 IPT/TIG domain-containing protein [Planctomycetota bacterium]HOE31375.1 IPT/TIG domain-containing protein [Planctomycetota bacterium]HOE88361.1 IPT/TIG domain-containing protein [Planctomycetota bacterium]